MTSGRLILAMDTSGPVCAAGLFDGSVEIARRTPELGRGHAERIVDLCAEMLGDAGAAWSDLGLVVVTVGPGSFTGVRAGVAAARGLALSLDVPARGVSTLESMGGPDAPPASSYMVALDARRGEVYAQPFAPTGEPLAGPALLPPERAARLLPEGAVEVVGSGASAVVEAAAAMNRPVRIGSREGVPHTAAQPDIRDVALAALRAGKDAAPPEPLYLRSADAKAAPSPLATLEPSA